MSAPGVFPSGADHLTYTFTPQLPQPKLLTLIVIGLVPFGFPLCALALVVYALIVSNANRPVWELAFIGLYLLQVVAFLMVIGFVAFRMSIGPWFGGGNSLSFIGTSVQHGGNRVCELADLRGLRLFVYPFSSDPPGKLRAALSLVIGDECGTHGLIGRIDATGLRTFADDMQRRLAAFRLNHGLMSALDPLSVVETTREATLKLMSTRPPASLTFRSWALRAYFAIHQKPLPCYAWCLAMLAGAVASLRLVQAVGLDSAFLGVLISPVIIHLLLSFSIRGKFGLGVMKKKKS